MGISGITDLQRALQDFFYWLHSRMSETFLIGPYLKLIDQKDLSSVYNYEFAERCIFRLSALKL